MRVGILTVSDRSASGERADASGPAIRQAIERRGWQVSRVDVVADEQAEIERQLINWADAGAVDIILTVGGTGFAPRDRTPEATQAVIERNAPGLPEAMREASLEKNPHAMLSRAVAGIRGRTLIINLPGSPKAAVENLEVVLAVLPHAVDLLQESPRAEGGHRPQPRRGHA
jgi:molybdopterin adenylyltransferase